MLLYHAIAGYLLLITLFFRAGWGLFGPKHSLFKDFPIGKQKVKDFMLNIFETEQKYIGHNPPASYVMLAILLFTFIIIITGALTYGIQEDKGIFAALGTTSLKDLELFESLHELFATILYFLIGAHLLGILTDKLLHKENDTQNSIVNGYKSTKEENNIKLTLFQKIFASFCLIIFLIFLAYNIYNPLNILVS